MVTRSTRNARRIADEHAADISAVYAAALAAIAVKLDKRAMAE